MIVDGRKIAEDIYKETRTRAELLSRVPVLTIITCNPNFETKKYLALKEKKASSIGVDIKIIELTESNTTNDFITAIVGAAPQSDGIIVQFPLPSSIDSDAVVKSIPFSHDVDGLNPENTKAHTPVVDACKEILLRNNISIQEKFATVIGSGRLVGLPMYRWLLEEGAHVSLVTKDTIEIEHYTKQADIVVCGAGVSGLLTPNMIKAGVVILDAGTSEDGGELKGDADPLCAEKASLFTPVPGGIGPITIAILLRNVVNCAMRK